MTSQVENQVKPNAVKDLVTLLAEKFPACFSLTGPAKPLKVGIFQDLAERLQDTPEISKTSLRQALRLYTSSWRYLDAIKEGTHRVDLDGVEGEVIDAQQAEHAATSLAESRAKAAEARKVRQQAERAKARAARADKAPEQKRAPAGESADKPAYKKSAPRKKPSEEKQVIIKQKPVAPKAPAIELTPIAEGSVKPGAKVLVKLGSQPLMATVVEVARQDVVVQLSSGMVIKTTSSALYQA
jgi:ProP effector